MAFKDDWYLDYYGPETGAEADYHERYGRRGFYQGYQGHGRNDYFNRHSPYRSQYEKDTGFYYGGPYETGAPFMPPYVPEAWHTPSPDSYRGRGPRNYRRSDASITEDLCERLTDDEDIDAREIEVQVKDGEVTLLGTVDDRTIKRMVEDYALSVTGVVEVHNRLTVRRPGGTATGRAA